MINIKLTPKQTDTLLYWLEYAQTATEENLDYVTGKDKVDLRNEYNRVISIKKKIYEEIL